MNKLFDLTERFYYSARFIYPAVNYMFKVNNRNTRTVCEICSKLTIKTPEWRHWRIGVWTSAFVINPFQGNVPFQFPPENVTKLLAYWRFQRKRDFDLKNINWKIIAFACNAKSFPLAVIFYFVLFLCSTSGWTSKSCFCIFFLLLLQTHVSNIGFINMEWQIGMCSFWNFVRESIVCHVLLK